MREIHKGTGIIATYKALLEKKGSLNLLDIAKIETSIEEKYKESKISFFKKFDIRFGRYPYLWQITIHLGRAYHSSRIAIYLFGYYLEIRRNK